MDNMGVTDKGQRSETFLVTIVKNDIDDTVIQTGVEQDVKKRDARCSFFSRYTCRGGGKASAVKMLSNCQNIYLFCRIPLE